MKKLSCALFIIIAICGFHTTSSGQILDKIKNKVKQRTDQKVDKTIDKGLDEVEGKNTKVKTDEDGEVKVKTEGGSEKKSNPQSLKAYSKYDFIPGDKIVYAEDFAQDVIGEFPMKWNTDGTGEIVTLEGQQGKWMKLIESTNYKTPYKNPLPENYTVEFDLLTEFKDDQAVAWIHAILEEDKPLGAYRTGTAKVTLMPNGGISVPESRDGIYYESTNTKGTIFLQGKKQLHAVFSNSNHKNTPVHVAIWVQKQRIRVWLNQEKMYDLPKGIDETVKLNALAFEIGAYGGPKTNYSYFLSNIKIAVAAPDTRNKLITEGKWSTTGILFDVNSDKIKPSSYGVLKEIATVLSENASVKVKIIGHTDSDGDDSKNLELSKKRALAVKNALNQEFNIDGERLETEGMGETKPVTDNKTSEGKGQNRRVEFVKI